MAKFEVHIPAADAGGFAMTLKVSADNWMSALKAGMTKLGEQGSSVQNVMVDIQEDNSIHVTESRSGRVFRIRELTEEEAAKAPVKRPSQIRPGVSPTGARGGDTQPNPPVPAASKTQIVPRATVTGGGLDADALQTIAARNGGPAAVMGTPLPKRKGTKSSPKIEVDRLAIEELEHPTQPVKAPIGRQKSTPAAQRDMKLQVEDMLAEVFERVQELGNKPNPEDALYFILDLALEKVPADAGSVLRADAGSGDLAFLAARGPKAKQLLASKITIPAGTGFAGFCSAEGVSVAISDVDKDPRYYAAIAEKVDYETKSLICAPMMTHGRSFGCLQLINRKGSGMFLEHEVGILSYLAHQAALYMNDRA
jgi:hypothetical protein